jgi:hypothetical protein
MVMRRVCVELRAGGQTFATPAIVGLYDRGSPLPEQRFDLSQERGELRLESVSDDSIVDFSVAVNQDVSERDDALRVPLAPGGEVVGQLGA